MKRGIAGILTVVALFLTSCALVTSNDNPINGTWKLSTIGGVPLSGVTSIVIVSDTIVISRVATFSETLVSSVGNATPAIPGTVTSKGADVYSLAYIDGSHRWDYTLSSDGTTLSTARDGPLDWVFRK